MSTNNKLLSGNEAIALGAYHAGIKVAAAYPGTPSTEILENLAEYKDIYAEWSTNEKVAMEVGVGASYGGVRTLVSMKHVGLNVAADPFMAVAITGINGGLVIISADDPGAMSSQNGQDNRHFAKLAKIPMLEPSDSQEAYDMVMAAFDISEQFDTPVLLRTTTRVSHSKTIVETGNNSRKQVEGKVFKYNFRKYVMLPANARARRPLVEERVNKLAGFSETSAFNFVTKGSPELGIITSGMAYQYVKEVFPEASILKLGFSYPMPQELIKEFSSRVKKLVVIEELDPFIEEYVKSLGIEVTGKEFVPIIGELTPDVIEKAGCAMGILSEYPGTDAAYKKPALPGRFPLLCSGCPHSGLYFTLSNIGQRSTIPGRKQREPKLIITGDIGCYTLGALSPLNAMDTCGCMGASIGNAIGMQKAGVGEKVVAIIGDSTFLHSGITGLIDAVYNKAKFTLVILDNRTTAMTGHQEHPGTGKTAQGEDTYAINLEEMVKACGVTDLQVVNAWDLKAIKKALKESLESDELSVIISRGPCAVSVRRGINPSKVDINKCTTCGLCLSIGCSAIAKDGDKVVIDGSLCAGDNCRLCEQVCPVNAIYPDKPGLIGANNE
ncbi:MAG: indolepyruvate ferredoxin oxidoreductase subunit alpha [Dehalococcoidales bacterium]|nr:indolepyruvate ferredoxin oxidoreductase subunit alpha [Dehalococcoidales bacterium]